MLQIVKKKLCWVQHDTNSARVQGFPLAT